MVSPRTDHDRRQFMKAAVAIGGASALSACLDQFREGEGPDVPAGVDDPTTLPDRQHAWNAGLPTDDHGNVRNARHHVVALLDYEGDGPTGAEREQVEVAFRSLERAYAWSHDGLLFTVGYSPYYFERVGAAVPDGVDLPKPEALSPFEDPEFDDPDAVVHLASDHAPVVLEAEQALLGERSSANDREMDADLTGVFSKRERRTGFVGTGLPAENQDVGGIPDEEPVPDDAPLYMGFKSGFTENQATEDFVTIEEGPFAGGTTQHLSKIRLRIGDWYEENTREENVGKMFCPVHADEGRIPAGDTGEALGDDSGMDEACKDVEGSAREHGRIGHSQKMAAEARTDDDSPLMIRRDFDTTDGGHAGLHFLAVQPAISDFVETREAMNGEQWTDNPAIRQRVNNGILEYTFVQRRGNYVLPPRSNRALPTP